MHKAVALLMIGSLCWGCQPAEKADPPRDSDGAAASDASVPAEPAPQPAPPETPTTTDEAEPTASDERIELTFETETVGEKYGPRHVLAVWVATDDGQFIRTLRLAAERRIRHLRTWRKVTKANKVDAVTSATLDTHGTHTVEWDGRGVDGEPAPDGMYHIFIEFSEKHGQGPLTPAGHIAFRKGGEAVELRPTDVPGIKNMRLTYAPAID